MTYTIAFYIDSVIFSDDVLNKRTSLGGSESACRGLAEALAARGHDVTIFATKLETPGIYDGVAWVPAERLPEVIQYLRHDVFVSLRFPGVFALGIPAKLRILWTQDLLVHGEWVGQLSGVDRVVFVSEYHREQWCEGREWLRPISYVTRNGFDPDDLLMAIPDPDTWADFGNSVQHVAEAPLVDAFMPDVITKRRNHFIYVSRPERGLDALINYWPAIRARIPDATLAVCRYSSMYDAGGWGRVCAKFDQTLEALNQRVGGIEWLGELDKRALYRAIAEAQLMVYPTSQAGFAETNCIASLEAQACGTPFVGSWRGALPETVHPDAGILIPGEWDTPETMDAFVDTLAYLTSAAGRTKYTTMRIAGFAHAMKSTHGVIAGEWESWITTLFADRFHGNRLGVLRQLMHWDNMRPARLLAAALLADFTLARKADDDPELVEVRAALALIDRVIAQEDHTAADYAAQAPTAPVIETRMEEALAAFGENWHGGDAPKILDVACGNGAFALAAAQVFPNGFVTGVDWSTDLIARFTAAQVDAGRIEGTHFNAVATPVWDAAAGTMATLPFPPASYDLVFCGEFLEHVEKPWDVIDALRRYVAPDGFLVFTVPSGPWSECVPYHIPLHRGHVSAFDMRDLLHMFGPTGAVWDYIHIGTTPHGHAIGNWIIRVPAAGAPAGVLDQAHDLPTIVTERPYERVTATMIVKNEADNLARCVKSFLDVVDHLVIIDFGSVDGTLDVLGSLVRGGQPEKITAVRATWPDDFAHARNRALEIAERRGTEWVFWIDGDEQLKRGGHLRAHIESPVFNAVTVEQRHMATVVDPYHDKPLRLFRANRGVRFFGAIHEQPEERPDVGINPALAQSLTYIAHFGYPDEDVRIAKTLNRNMRLLQKALKSDTPRELDQLFLMRDHITLAGLNRRKARGAMTPIAEKHLAAAVAIWDRHAWGDPTNRLHPVAWPIYQLAMTHLDAAIDTAWTVTAARGRLNGSPQIERFRVRTPAEATAYIAAKTAVFLTQLDPPAVRVAPVATVNAHVLPDGWRDALDATREVYFSEEDTAPVAAA